MKEFVEKLIGRLREATYDMEICEEQFDMNSPYFMDVDYKMVKFDDAKAIINELAEEYNNGWIPCSERLPSENERWLGKDITDAEPREFIVMVKGAYEPTTGYYTVDGWVKDIYDKDNTSGYANEIIAWRFFPTPYRSEKEEWKDKIMKHFTNVE
jgi:hypothetical protein